MKRLIISYLAAIASMTLASSAACAEPAENSKSAYFSEVITATQPYKLAVEACYQTQGGGDDVKNCAGGKNGVPANIATSQGNVGSVVVSDNGVITANGSALHGLSSETYILTPVANNNTLTWNISGTCVQDQLC